MFKVPPKWFTRFLLELHDILSNKSDLMDMVEFFQENPDEIISRCDKINR